VCHALLTAALDLLSQHGPAALRVRDVAERAGCSTMGVYTCFGSKHGLIEALFRLGFGRLLDALRAIGPSSDPRADVLKYGLAYREFGLANPALYAVMFERAMPDFTPSPAARSESLASYAVLVSAMQRFPRLNPDWAAYVFWCTAHGLISIELTHRRWGGPLMPHLQSLDRGLAFEQAMLALLDGLLAPA
jgi:AcrR family transcriptional regulator